MFCLYKLKMKNHALGRGSESNNVDFVDRGVNPARSEGHRIDVIKLRDARKYQDGFKPCLEASQNIGAKVVTDNNGFF